MSIQELKKLVPPPDRPSEVGSLEAWREIERKIGLVLPSDYRDFIFTYGSGLFAQFYRVCNPFDPSEWISLYASVERVCNSEGEIKRKFPDQVPYPIYPQEAGILPWGNDENGNEYFWLTQGAPDTWLVLSDEVRGEGFREYGCSITEFLTKVLIGHIEALASDYPREENFVFEPFID